MLEVLLALGLMIVMTPVILNQIRKYNEQIAREEVVAQMALLRKAVQSYISFDRSAVPGGCVEVEGNRIKQTLANYGGRSLSLRNGFGQDYYFVTCRKLDGDVVAYVGAKGGGLNAEELGGIAAFLFDQGAMVNADNIIVSNYNFSMDPELDRIARTNRLSLIMFVSDANITSDFLHADRISGPQGALVNTMLVDLYMSNNPIRDIKAIYGAEIVASRRLGIAGAMTGVKAEIVQDFDIKNAMSFQGDVREIRDSLPGVSFPFSPLMLYLDQMSAGNVEFLQVNIPNADLRVRELSGSRVTVRGDMTMDGVVGDLDIGEVSAAMGLSAGSSPNNASVMMLDDRDGSGVAYSGRYGDGNFDPTSSSSIALSGVSEVIDICWGDGRCVSDQMYEVFNQLRAISNAYYTVNARIECARHGKYC